MKNKTIQMLKTLKKITNTNVEEANKRGDWLEAEQWKTVLFTCEKIEEYENITL